jgi:hypothetical protein
MTDWPSTLPQRFLAADYSDTLPDNVIKTQMDAGPPKRRRKTTANIQVISGSMILTTTQWNSLVTFFQDTLKETLNFTLPEPGNDGVGTLNVVFSGPPQRQYFGPGRWRVALRFEVQP